MEDIKDRLVNYNNDMAAICEKHYKECVLNTVEELCEYDSYKAVMHRSHHHVPMPSVEVLKEVVDRLRAVLFPGYFRNMEVDSDTMKFHIGASIDKIFKLLSEQIRRGFCFACNDSSCGKCEEAAVLLTAKFISRLPEIRRLLATDVDAAYEGDPAAKHPGEVIFSYPSLRAMTYYRIAHELFTLEVPFIPRIITEMAHTYTGIDIHPGAQIGKKCFIDHGTAVVIGETSIIGNNVRIYQCVTLGAKSFPVDEHGNPIKGIPRHPILEDDVVIYSGATILGRVTIGKGSIIGGNVWLTHSVPPGTRILQESPGNIIIKGKAKNGKNSTKKSS